MSRSGVNDDVGEGEAAAGAAALDVEAGATAEAGAESFGAAEQKQGSARGRLAAAVLAVGKGNNPAPPWRGALRQTASMFVREALADMLQVRLSFCWRGQQSRQPSRCCAPYCRPRAPSWGAEDYACVTSLARPTPALGGQHWAALPHAHC